MRLTLGLADLALGLMRRPGPFNPGLINLVPGDFAAGLFPRPLIRLSRSLSLPGVVGKALLGVRVPMSLVGTVLAFFAAGVPSFSFSSPPSSPSSPIPSSLLPTSPVSRFRFLLLRPCSIPLTPGPSLFGVPGPSDGRTFLIVDCGVLGGVLFLAAEAEVGRRKLGVGLALGIDGVVLGGAGASEMRDIPTVLGSCFGGAGANESFDVGENAKVKLLFAGPGDGEKPMLFIVGFGGAEAGACKVRLGYDTDFGGVSASCGCFGGVSMSMLPPSANPLALSLVKRTDGTCLTGLGLSSPTTLCVL